MAQKSIAFFSNEYKDLFERLDLNVANSVTGEFGLEELKKKAVPVLKNRFIDIIYLDYTVFKNPADVIEFVKHIRLVSDDLRGADKGVRIVLIAPNLVDETILHYLVTYRVYDIVNPLTGDALASDVLDLLYSEVSLNLANPNTFSKVEALLKPLSFSGDTTQAKGKPSEVFDPKFLSGAGSIINKVFSKERNRTYVVYNDPDPKQSFVKKIERHAKRSKLQYVEYKPISEDVKQSLSNIRQLFVDVLVLYRPTLEQFKEIYEVVSTVDGSIGVYVFNTEYDAYEKISKYLASKGIIDVKSHFLSEVNISEMENAIFDIRSTQTKLRQENILRNKATVVAVVGAKGGVGTTSVSALLGKAFGTVSRLKVAVVDFSYFVGDLNVVMGIPEPDKNIFSWFRFAVEMRRNKVADAGLHYDMIMEHCYRVKEDENLYALVTPNKDFFEYTDYDISDEERHEALIYTIDALKSVFDIVILDVNTKYSNFDIAMQNATHTIIVTDPHISSVYRFKYGLLSSVLDNMYRIRHENIYLVVNKDMSKHDDLQQQIGAEMIKAIGNAIDSKNIIRIGVDGSISKSSDLLDIKSTNRKTNKDILGLANSILNVIQKQAKKGNQSNGVILYFFMSILSVAAIVGTYWYLFIRQ